MRTLQHWWVVIFVAAILFVACHHVEANPHIGHARGYLCEYETDAAPAQPGGFCVFEIPGEPLPFNVEATLTRAQRAVKNFRENLEATVGRNHCDTVQPGPNDPPCVEPVESLELAEAQLAGFRIDVMTAYYALRFGVPLQDVRKLVNSPTFVGTNSATEKIMNASQLERRIGNVGVGLQMDRHLLDNPSNRTIGEALAGTQFYVLRAWAILDKAIWHINDAIQWEFQNE